MAKVVEDYKEGKEKDGWISLNSVCTEQNCRFFLLPVARPLRNSFWL